VGDPRLHGTADRVVDRRRQRAGVQAHVRDGRLDVVRSHPVNTGASAALANAAILPNTIRREASAEAIFHMATSRVATVGGNGDADKLRCGCHGKRGLTAARYREGGTNYPAG